MFGNEGRTLARSGARARDEIGRRPSRCVGGNTGAQGDAPAIFDTRGEVLRTFREVEERAILLGHQIESHPPGTGLSDRDRQPAGLAVASSRLLAPTSHCPAPREFDHAAATRSRAYGFALRANRVWAHQRPVLLKLTSGTTAAPRAIRFRSEQLLADCIQICDTMGIGPDDLNFGVIPLSHSYGFSNVVTPLLVRGVRVVLSRDRMPRAMLDDLARTGATVFPGMPVFYQAFCEMERRTLAAEIAALHFGGRAVAARSRAEVSREIPSLDPFVLRVVGVRRDLLRSRSAPGASQALSGNQWRE